MRLKNLLVTLLCSGMLAACGSAGTTGSITPDIGGDTGGGDTGGGDTAGGDTGGAGDGIQLRGLATKFNKAKQAGMTVPGAPDIYELTTGDFVSDDAPATRTGAGITASLKLEGPQATGGNATLATGGKFANGQSVPGTTASWGQTISNADGDTDSQYIKVGDPNVGDKIRVVSTDVDADGSDDFFAVDQHVGGVDVRQAQETVGIYYGGDFAPAAALNGKTTATYSRVAGSQDAGVVRVMTGPGLANAHYTIYKGDVNLTADFNAGKVNGRIGNMDRIAGTGATNFDVVLENAAINGVHYDNGSVRVVNAGTNTNTATIDNSAFIGSFMGQKAERTSGVFQATGAMGGDPAFISGRFSADEVKN